MVKATQYTECLAFCPVVRIGSPRPPNRKCVVPPPPLVGGKHSLAGEGAGGANSVLYCRYVYYHPSTLSSLLIYVEFVGIKILTSV